jgi:4-hydroxyacetophenone monooxygenase
VNLEYFEWIADRYGVREDITFDTEVRAVVWDDITSLVSAVVRCPCSQR